MQATTSRVRNVFYGIAATAAVAVGHGAVGFTTLRAQAPAPILVEPLTPRSVFTEEVSGQFRIKAKGQGTEVVNMSDASRTVIARITVQPGAQFPWHTHSGPVVVNVAQGELVYLEADNCVPKAYAAGTAFVDPGQGHVHTAFNRTSSVTVLYATFFQVAADGPLTITAGVEIPTDCHIEN